MTKSITESRTASLFEVGTGASIDDVRLAPAPRLRLLYHVDLARIGGFSHPELALEDGQWRTIGRKQPLFITPMPGDVWRPLSDPTVSREQLRVRWLGADASFEVEPLPNARRRVLLLDPRGTDAPVELLRRTRASPGCCIAIDDRVLLGLEVLPRFHGPEEDRLGLVGESPELWRLREEIRGLGPLRRPVLILGQTGTGKELVAGAIHRCGRGEARPLRTLNCAALPDSLVESLLFGHAKGAFTGADASHTGVFEAADGGTLLLDELGEMPLSVQPKLLRVLQDGLVTPLGRQRGIEVDVRLLAATNRDPALEIAAGRLRADLYHRIAAHVVEVSPLGARRFDIPALFVGFLARCREEHAGLRWLWHDRERWRVAIPLAFFVELLRGAWPGNVRELENVAERVARHNLHGPPFSRPALVRGPAGGSSASSTGPSASPRSSSAASPTTRDDAHDERLRAASHRLGIASKTLAKLVSRKGLAEIWDGDEAAVARLEAYVRERLHARLEEHGFAQGRVAKALGVSAWTLIRLMHRLELVRPMELTPAQIERALAAAAGDVAVAARSLGVSEHGLKKRRSALGQSR